MEGFRSSTVGTCANVMSSDVGAESSATSAKPVGEDASATIAASRTGALSGPSIGDPVVSQIRLPRMVATTPGFVLIVGQGGGNAWGCCEDRFNVADHVIAAIRLGRQQAEEREQEKQGAKCITQSHSDTFFLLKNSTVANETIESRNVKDTC